MISGLDAPETCSMFCTHEGPKSCKGDEMDQSLMCREDVYGKHYYKDQWEKIEDEHYPECSVAIAARKKLTSTFCICKQIEISEDCIMDEIQ